MCIVLKHTLKHFKAIHTRSMYHYQTRNNQNQYYFVDFSHSQSLCANIYVQITITS